MLRKKLPDDVTKCYGSLKVSAAGRDDIVSGCKNVSCPLREACISRSREETELRNFRLMTVPLEDKLSRVEYLFSRTPDPEQAADKVLADLGVAEDKADELRDAVEILAALYIKLPRIFDAAMRRLFNNQTHADVARIKGITRQAVQKGGIAELAGVRNPLAYMPPDLEGMELAVYDLCSVKKMSIRKAAEKLKVSKDEIFRLRQKISSKLTKNATVKNRTVKKNGKNL